VTVEVLEAPATTACPICGCDRFIEHAGRPLARCGGCDSLERHRALVRSNAARLDHGRGRSAIEIGPLNRRVFGDHLRERGWRYIGIDGSRAGNPHDPRSVDFIDYETDARELAPIADRAMWLVIVQHVLEEIDEYDRALAAIARVLAPDGTALLEIPFDPERPDSAHHPPDRFGNVWSFGRDLLDVVHQHFDTIEVVEYAEGVSRGRFLVCGHDRIDSAVAAENALRGDSRWWGAHAPPSAIDGYFTAHSVAPGGRLELHVSTRPAERYRITIHRLGWYGGDGARTLTIHPGPRSDLQGVPREPPELRSGPTIASAGWPVTDVIAVEDSWPTGLYVARLALTTGPHREQGAYLPFVVRAPFGTAAAVLVQQPVMTAQAHNDVGGATVAGSESPARTVSFDRPLPGWSSASLEARWPFAFDYQLARFLEREGVDVEYTTDIDIDREPWKLELHRMVIVSGATEYWTLQMRDAFRRARAAGVAIVSIGPSTDRRRVELHDDRRTLVACPETFEPLVAHGHDGLDVDDSGALASGSPEFVWGLDDWGHEGHADDGRRRLVRDALIRLIG
jgi:SAM-dependent methyltransferase